MCANAAESPRALAYALTDRWTSHRARIPRQEPPPHGTLYHYTTAVGLGGMLASGFLWASNAEFMNDRGELEYPRPMLRSELEDLSRRASGLARELLQGTLAALERLWRTGAVSRYMACFCTEDNLLSQWRGLHGR